MWTRRNQFALLAVFVSFAVTLSGCGGSGRGTADSPPTDTAAAMALAGVLNDSNSPAIARYGARLPPPDPEATCQALTIGCEGGLGPIHYGSVREYDFSDFDYRERRRGVSVAERTGVSREGDRMTDHRALAGWISHSLFVIETPPSGGRRGSSYGAFSIGNTTGSNPDVLVDNSATWSGVMFGSRISDPDAFVHGDALVTVSNPDGDGDLVVDVEFTNIKEEDTDNGLDDVSWSGLELTDGSFGVVPVAEDWWPVSRHPASRGISGRFYGPSHEEVGGLFGWPELPMAGDDLLAGGGGYGVSGVFGAKRD